MTIGKNTTVTIDYTLKDDQGNLLEDTKESGAVAYLHGAGFMIPTLEEALDGKEEGAELSVALSAEDAYGPRDEKLVLQVPRADFENPETVAIGEQVQIHDGEEGGIMRVADLDDDMVTLDGNHPFAGKGIVFAISVRGVRETSQEDIDAVTHHHDHDHDCGCGSHDEGGCCGGHAGGDCGDEEKKGQGGCCGGH